MKSYICIIISFIILPLSYTYAASGSMILRPSLHAQMQKQNEINKQNLIAQKKLANQERLRAIAAQKKLVSAASGGTKKIIAETNISTKTTGVTITPTLTPSLTLSSRVNTSQTPIPGVDMTRVRNTWFGWYNEYRASLGLSPYLYDPRLDGTSRDWNIVFSASRGQNHHRRNPGDSYYSFSTIDAWFAARGIQPPVKNRAKHTENVGYGYYNCSQSDCTDELIAGIRTTWEFFMSEKGKSYDAHYQTIINPDFTKMGYDIIVVPSEKRYYIVAHFITE